MNGGVSDTGGTRPRVVSPTAADTYCALKTAYHAPLSTRFGGGTAMGSPLFSSPLALWALTWHCVRLQRGWPRRSAAPPPAPETPMQPTRQRATEPQPVAGLPHTPPGVLWQQETGETHLPPPVQPAPLPRTHRRPQTVETSRHVCPHSSRVGMHSPGRGACSSTVAVCLQAGKEGCTRS
jgi:hypothetical protein